MDNMQQHLERYFIVKCANIQSLEESINTCVWACKDRDAPPHPRHILSNAFKQGRVLLIFSVNNCHGWHGVCEMEDIPGSCQIGKSNTSVSCNESEDGCCGDVASSDHADSLCGAAKPEVGTHVSVSVTWHRFPITWLVSFSPRFGQRCLSSETTKDLVTLDGNLLNMARNWQEISMTNGQHIHNLIKTCYADLLSKEQEKLEAVKLKQPMPFYAEVEPGGDAAEAVWSMWRGIVEKVENQLGRVIMACPYGSQRYNLHTVLSDVDMYIVYQAHTRDVLSLKPPKVTIKSGEAEKLDYTIVELQRFCELLCAGDARCIEMLYLHSSSVITMAESWQQLLPFKHLFLNSCCLDKYLRDALGSNGLKHLDKWMSEKRDGEQQMTQKIIKVIYIVIRLLQNARQITLGQDLHVFRQNGSDDRELLMKVRQQEITIQEARKHIQSLLDDIETNRSGVPAPSEELFHAVNQFLLKARYDDFSNFPP